MFRVPSSALLTTMTVRMESSATLSIQVIEFSQEFPYWNFVDIRQCSFVSVLYRCTAERRDVLGNASPEAREISRGRGFCTPRPEGDVFPNASRLEAVYVHSLSISREVLILWSIFHLKLERSPS